MSRLGEWGIERSTVVRALVIGALFALALFAVPELIGIYWVKILTAAAIYSVVALGLGLLYGRVGMVSLCQVALLAVGAWTATRGTGRRSRGRSPMGSRRPTWARRWPASSGCCCAATAGWTASARRATTPP